tara:strand:+ start:97 stop:834 length:738 start_codon:yes stop_codon:yes gene_type:complete
MKTHFPLFNTIIKTVFVMTVLSGQENNSETVAVLPLTGTNIPNSELTIYSDRLDAELFKLKNYIFVERELMSEILTEQGFQQTGCTTDECAVKIGELLGVKFLITGSLGKLESLYTVNLKMIDVETGKIRYKYSYDCDCSSKELLISGLKNAVQGGFGVKEVASIKDSNVSSTKTMSSLIVIKSTPQNARVHLGGKYVGKTPLSLADYKKGNYSMMVLLPGFKTYRSNIKITGKSEDIQIKLEKK